jgi:hypothetical protein
LHEEKGSEGMKGPKREGRRDDRTKKKKKGKEKRERETGREEKQKDKRRNGIIKNRTDCKEKKGM